MKSFIASLLLFSVMVGGIILNSRYLGRLSSELTEAAEAIPALDCVTSEKEQREERFEHLRSIWRENRTIVSFTVTMRMVEGIDDCLGALEAAIRYGTADEFDKTREHLLRIIEDLGYYDAIQLGSVL